MTINSFPMYVLLHMLVHMKVHWLALDASHLLCKHSVGGHTHARNQIYFQYEHMQKIQFIQNSQACWEFPVNLCQLLKVCPKPAQNFGSVWYLYTSSWWRPRKEGSGSVMALGSYFCILSRPSMKFILVIPKDVPCLNLAHGNHISIKIAFSL